MVSDSGPSLDHWQRFFRGAPAKADIFAVLERAIAIAATDFPESFRSRRDRIAELLFTATITNPAKSSDQGTRISGSEVVEQEEGAEREEEGEGERDGSVREKESKAGSCDTAVVEPEMNDRIVSNYSYDEAEALTEEIEEEKELVGEVLRIKSVLLNKNDESDSVLFDALRRLQLMPLTLQTLKATEIGIAVAGLKKHNSKQVRRLVRMLIDGWKVLVDQWVSTTEAIAVKQQATGNSPDSVNPPSTLDEEEGLLPSPPMDEGAFLTTQTACMQLSDEFFAEMDDDGNLRSAMEPEKLQETHRRQVVNNTLVRNQQCPCHSNIHDDAQKIRRKVNIDHSVDPQDEVQVLRRENVVYHKIPGDNGQIRGGQHVAHSVSAETTRHITGQEQSNRQALQQGAARAQVKPEVTKSKHDKPSGTDFRLGRLPKPASEQRPSSELQSSQHKQVLALQRRPGTTLPDKSDGDDDDDVKARLEVAKRKLHARYQEQNDKKKQKVIQVLEIKDAPKQKKVMPNLHRQQNAKPKSQLRNWLAGRR